MEEIERRMCRPEAPNFKVCIPMFGDLLIEKFAEPNRGCLRLGSVEMDLAVTAIEIIKSEFGSVAMISVVVIGGARSDSETGGEDE